MTDSNLDVRRIKGHLPGIIPVSGQPLDFHMDWHDSMMPVAPDLTAVERSILDCLHFGCDTIWLVCNDDIAPLFRHRIGEKTGFPNKGETSKPIQIFYVPFSTVDIDNKDCLSWGALRGADIAHRISLKLSKWLVPDKYFVSFPYGVHNPKHLKAHRRKFAIFNYKGKTILDNEYVPFVMTSEDYFECRDNFRNSIVGSHINNVRVRPHEKYTGRFFTPAQVFSEMTTEDKHQIEIPWHYNIDSWEGYCKYLGSEHKNEIERTIHLKYREWNQIGVDYDEKKDLHRTRIFKARKI